MIIILQRKKKRDSEKTKVEKKEKNTHTESIAHVIFRCQNGSSDQDSIQNVLGSQSRHQKFIRRNWSGFFPIHMKIQHQYQQHIDRPVSFGREPKKKKWKLRALNAIEIANSLNKIV